MNPDRKEAVLTGLLERFRKSWFPPAAAVGAFSAFVAAAFRIRPEPRISPSGTAPPGPPKPVSLPVLSQPTLVALDWEYSLSFIIGGAASAYPFRRALAGVAAGSGDTIFTLGDDEVRIFDSKGSFARNWRVIDKASCITVGSDGQIYIGSSGRIEIYDGRGIRKGGFLAGEQGRQAEVTAVKVCRSNILVADAAARIIRRFDLSGRQIGQIGTKSKAGSFILPNRWLDFAVDSKGTVYATDTGRHLVTAWDLDGSPLGSFGKFGMSNPEDFVGCCNPVNLAVTADGKIVTAEKMVARVKVYESDGRLLAVIGPENFDPQCTHIHLAVDSRGRILAADPVRREIKVFSRLAKTGASGPFDKEPERA